MQDQSEVGMEGCYGGGWSKSAAGVLAVVVVVVEALKSVPVSGT